MGIISFGTQADYQSGDSGNSITRAAYDALGKKGHASGRISNSAVGIVPTSDSDQGHVPLRPKVAGAQGNVGTLNLQANGSCTFAVANSAMQYLGASGDLLLFT